MNNLEGTVNYINDKLLYFKVDDIFVNVAIYLANQLSVDIVLPNLGDRLFIRKAHPHEDVIKGDNVFSLCHNSECNEFKVPALKGLHYLWIVKDYKLGLGDLFTITNMYESVKDTISSETNLSDVVLRYIEDILVKTPVETNEIGSCEKNKLPTIQCKTISQCKNIQIKGNAYNKFPYWSYGIHWSISEEVLIGYVFVHPKFGTICFKDELYTVGCVIIKDCDVDVSDILNKTVYISKYCIFTEIFNPNTKFNLEYLVFNFSNLKVIDKKRKREDMDHSLQHKLEFIIISKSYVSFSQIRNYHFWLEIEEVNGAYLKNHNRYFLCIPDTFIEKWAFLEISFKHTIWFDEDLKRICDVEYTRLNPNLVQYCIPRSKHVLISSKKEFVPSQQIPFLDNTTIQQLGEQKGLISFQAILKYRKFSPANSSRTKSFNVPPCFGTLGDKTHILDFQVNEVKTLVLYLNNWEKIVMPVGLIPGVLVNVRNVILQKNYCKSTPFTSFEIVEFKPKFFMQTAKLLSDEDWGPPYFLGARSIPSGVLVFGIINFFFIKKLSITRSCSKCLYISKQIGKLCIKCKNTMELS
ncbi:hypothetical protein WA026_011532 [Henosepilachna vigintioctopunctata]